jgi:hypothetical protein
MRLRYGLPIARFDAAIGQGNLARPHTEPYPWTEDLPFDRASILPVDTGALHASEARSALAAGAPGRFLLALSRRERIGIGLVVDAPSIVLGRALAVRFNGRAYGPFNVAGAGQETIQVEVDVKDVRRGVNEVEVELAGAPSGSAISLLRIQLAALGPR